MGVERLQEKDRTSKENTRWTSSNEISWAWWALPGKKRRTSSRVSRQSSMAWTCGQVHPLGCGMNQCRRSKDYGRSRHISNAIVGFWILIGYLQDNVATHLRYGGSNNNHCFCFNWKCVAECAGERILKIGEYLMKLWSYKIWWLTFRGTPSLKEKLFCIAV